MGRKSRKKKTESFKSKSRFSLKYIFVLVATLFIFGLLGLVVISSYTGFGSPPIPKSIVRIADIAIASSPVLPKNPSQVVAKALFETSRVDSGEHMFNLQLIQDVEGGKNNSIFSLKIAGPFTKSSNQIDLAVTANFSVPNNEGDSKVDFIEKDDFVYLRLENVPDLFGLDLDKLQGSWYKLDITKVLSDAKASTRTDTEIEKTVSEKVRTVMDVFESERLIRNITVLPDENVDGQFSYHYKIDLNEEQTKKVLDSLSGGSEELPSIKRIAFELWIDKESFVINRLLISGILASEPERPSENVVLKLPDVNFELLYELKYPNEDIGINTPESTKDLNSLLDLYLLVQNDEETDPASAILGAVSNLGEFGANFLTIERLLHVLYLAPQAF